MVNKNRLPGSVKTCCAQSVRRNDESQNNSLDRIKTRVYSKTTAGKFLAGAFLKIRISPSDTINVVMFRGYAERS
ncbi:uncharacterized protein conserved in bacteria [Acetobacter aceti NRIC 0242]|nr:uncharacterized protein conserved in bacteria [Acetobacter aceti NRIC 0242]